MKGETKRQAFSLLELLAILALVSVVGAVVLFRLNANDQRATDESVIRQNIDMLQSAVERFRFDRNRFPADLDDLARDGYIMRVPGEPRYYKYRYDPATGLVDFTEK
ncbi:MAG: hypothetical protein RIS70_625 [Planctomycetota bacterium]